MKTSAGNGLRSSARFSLMAFVGLALAGGTLVRGQSALDGFDPNPNGLVDVVAVQPDGKILIGGDFIQLAPNGGPVVLRNHIARLNPDGTVDMVFDPNPNTDGRIYAIAVQTDGKVLIGGTFTTLRPNGGPPVTRNRIARLNPDGTVDAAFDPNANGEVDAIVVQADGKILAGGFFTSIGGQPRNNIARLDATTGLADSFNPNANNEVKSIVVQADGRILVGGYFFGANSIGGQTRNRVARLDPTTGLADSFNPNANNVVPSIAVQADGKILVGGDFHGANSIGGQTRNYIARLDATTGLADSFDPNADSGVDSIAVQADGKILAGGSFSNIGGQPRNAIARLDPATGLADSFHPEARTGDLVFSIALQSDGKILTGSTKGIGKRFGYIARFETDGRLDQTLDLGGPVGGFVDATAVQPDGKILVVGAFWTVLGITRNNIARLNTDGTLDTAFNPNANGEVDSIAVQADGKILAGGNFSNIGGQTRHFIARLDGATGLADSFNPNADNIVNSIAVQGDGKILAGGAFTTIGGQTRFYVARLDPATGLADSFDPHADNAVLSIAAQADGKILASGYFTGIGGQPRNRIARLDATTGLADSFDPNANGPVDSIAVQADGKILAGGEFNNIGGQTRSLLARLSNDTAALQDLAVTQTTITWTRGGSSSQFSRVTFEYSTDNVSYTPLGNGTANGSNWTLTGLSLPTEQNFYIRAQGYYRSGFQNGSEGITESVRNAFLGAVPMAQSAFSRKTHGAAGTFDVPLPLTGNVGVECRSGGATNDYQMIFNFANSVTVGSASVTSGTGSVSSFSVSGSQVTVNLTGVTNVQRITVTLINVNDGTHMGNVSVSMGVLIGDVNGNAVVNASDVSLTKSQVGQAVSSSNFREDVNANGLINSVDVAQVKANVGTALPP
jgi:uncharacterized delta-60 repeat protein